MATAWLTAEEKARIRHHTGYLLVDPVASIQLGIPRASQSMFLLEASMDRIPESAVGLIRRYVAVLDQIEDMLFDSTTRFAATQVGDLHLNDNEPAKLETEYARWAKRLADDLGIPLNPFSERFRSGTLANLSVPVHQ